MTDTEQPSQWAVKEIETVTGDFLTELGAPFYRIEIDGYCADFDYREAAENFAAAIQRAFAERGAELVAENAKLREAGETLRREATMLCQNAQACAVNHYREDFAVHGMPQWLADSQARIQSAAHALAQQDTTALKSREAGHG